MPDGNIQLSTDAATGDMIYQYPDTATTTALSDSGHFENLSAYLDSGTIDSLCDTLTELVTYDEDGRKGWMDIGTDAYNLLGVGPESEADDAGGKGDTSDHPLMLTALTRFQSKAYAALLPSGDRAVRTAPAIDLDDIEDPEERLKVEQDTAEAGQRVERFYTYYLFERLDTYEADTDQILHDCGMMGVGIRKIFTDRSRRNTPVRPVLVNLSDLIISYDATSFTSGRITHRIKMPTSELVRMIQSGQYRSFANLSPERNTKTGLESEIDRINGLLGGDYRDDAIHTLYEVHTDLRLNEDPHPLGMARPYIVTIHSTSREVLSIVRNWEEDDVDEDRIEHFVAYPFSPGKSGTSPMGLSHLLSNITRALRDAQRAALDAAYLQNHPSGFKLSSFKIRDDGAKILPGEFVDIDAPTDNIRSAIMLHPFEGPSQGLMALADKMQANGQELGGIASIDFAQLMKAGVAAGPAMAAYEESSTFQTAIHRRLYKAMATELRMIHARMRQVHGNSPVLYGSSGVLRPGDLIKVNILPAMKPGETSKQKNLLEAQALWDMAKALPDIIDPRKAAMKMLRALGEPNIDDILKPDPAEEEPKPADPASEYGTILKGDPVKAGISQNHQAHIDAHAAQMKMLLTSQLPVEKGEAAMAALAAHIADHMAQQAIMDVATRTGIPPQKFEEGIPPEMEVQIAPQIAAAIQQVEKERKPADPAEGDKAEKIAVEQLKAQGRQTELQLKNRQAAQLEQLKHQHAQELQAQKDAAQMEREEADNNAALEIAAMKAVSPSNAGTGVRASAGAGAGAKSNASAGSGETK